MSDFVGHKEKKRSVHGKRKKNTSLFRKSHYQKTIIYIQKEHIITTCPCRVARIPLQPFFFSVKKKRWRKKKSLGRVYKTLCYHSNQCKPIEGV